MTFFYKLNFGIRSTEARTPASYLNGSWLPGHKAIERNSEAIIPVKEEF